MYPVPKKIWADPPPEYAEHKPGMCPKNAPGRTGGQLPRRLGARVRHGEREGLAVAQRGVELVPELAAPDALAARAVPQRVARLQHERLDDACAWNQHGDASKGGDPSTGVDAKGAPRRASRAGLGVPRGAPRWKMSPS